MIMCLKQLQAEVNCSMGGAPSMIYSGAVGEVGGMMVSSTVSSITSGFEMQEGLDVTLYSLQQEVMKFQCAIEAARGRRITNNNQKLLEWLAQIIYASYLGNYYLRTFKSHTSLPPMIGSPQGMSNLPSDNCPTNRATKRQRTIRTFLFGNDEHREVHDVLKKLRSFDMVSFLLMVNAQPERPMKRYLYLEPTRLIYRAKEREQVMKFLFEPNMDGENNVDILPIVGSSGVGKTTLALDCFYDPKVQTHFSLKVYNYWSSVCYADYKYDSSGTPLIVKQILQQLNSTYIINFDENTLLAMLKQKLSSEKFLIVMDGVWDHPDLMVWNALLGCLRCGKQGSKIIFISNLIVYKKIKNHETVKPIMLHGFLEDEYMLFFMEHAFGGADPEDFPDLAKLGGEIAKNLDGSIWGAKIIGELLRDNLNVPFWSIFSRVGFLSSKFHGNKDLWPVTETFCQLLPNKRLCLTVMTHMIAGDHGILYTCDEVKSFRELMVLDPKYCTPKYCPPVIKPEKNNRLEFLVTKHFDLHRSSAFFGVCEEPPIYRPVIEKKKEGSTS